MLGERAEARLDTVATFTLAGSTPSLPSGGQDTVASLNGDAPRCSRVRARTNPKAKQRRTHRGQYAVWCTNQSLPRTAGRRHPSGSAPRKVLHVGLHRGRRLLHATDALCQRRARLVPAARAPKDARQLSGDCGLIRLDRPRQLLAHRSQLDTVATGCQKGTVATGHLQRAGSLGRAPPADSAAPCRAVGTAAPCRSVDTVAPCFSVDTVRPRTALSTCRRAHGRRRTALSTPRACVERTVIHPGPV